MALRTFLFDDGSSRKYWSVLLAGKTQTVEYARVGSVPNVRTKTFDLTSDAKTATVKPINEKLSFGYIDLHPESVKFKKAPGVRKADERQVREIEKQLGVKLPKDYVRFLKSTNGGHPDPGFISIPGHPYIDNVSIDTFLWTA
jgi:predicted DNA-binding WGR domain protein